MTSWVVQRIKSMNPNVDSEVFATFLLGIESPNEIEDYIFSYFGETKAAKQLHQEFLAKRIELRPRRGVKKEDVSGLGAQNYLILLFRICRRRPMLQTPQHFRVIQVQKGEAKSRRKAKRLMCQQ